MELRPQISKSTYDAMEQDAKLGTLYDMQASTMECVSEIHKSIERRKLFDRLSIIIGSIAGGILGALGLKGISQ